MTKRRPKETSVPTMRSTVWCVCMSLREKESGKKNRNCSEREIKRERERVGVCVRERDGAHRELEIPVDVNNLPTYACT